MDGKTVPFHAFKNKELFDLLLGVTTKLNHVNKENENIITYTCILDKIRCFAMLFVKLVMMISMFSITTVKYNYIFSTKWTFPRTKRIQQILQKIRCQLQK